MAGNNNHYHNSKHKILLINLTKLMIMRLRQRFNKLLNKVPLRIKRINDPLKLLHGVKPHDINELKQEYLKKGLDKVPDKFVLYRIIGNDLYPRHKKGQSIENLQFLLENEPKLESCEKRWVVNRIIDPDQERKIIKLLRSHQQPFIHIPFNPKEYRATSWDTDCFPEPGFLASEQFEILLEQDRIKALAAAYRLKNNYVMNNNGARNIALRDGRKRAKWILPWDGNCFITTSAWQQIRTAVIISPYLKYFVVPMARVTDNSQLLSDKYSPRPVEEPQIIFRMDSTEEFNENFCYGRRPKVELFWRLGIPGNWDRWRDDPWDLKRPARSPEARQFGVAGWVARLSSGMKMLEQNSLESFKQRGRARTKAIIDTLQYVDFKFLARTNTLSFLRAEQLEKEYRIYRNGWNSSLTKLVNQLIKDAEAIINFGFCSIIDKTSHPSSNANGYSNPKLDCCLNRDIKYKVPHDLKNIADPKVHTTENEIRIHPQRLFDDTLILALAWKFTGNRKFAEYGTQLLERFFINPGTRMIPHLQYEQVNLGLNKIKIFEMKDLYYYLDAVQLMASDGTVTNTLLNQFKEWLCDYLEWLINHGKKDRQAVDYHGTYYDLQIAAIAAFVGQYSLVYETLLRAQTRITLQFCPDGSQHNANNIHDCMLNFQAWINLAEIASRWGIDLWAYKASSGASLRQGAQWLLSQTDASMLDRILPVWFAIPKSNLMHVKAAHFPDSKYKVKPLFSIHEGVRPYWNLGMQDQEIEHPDDDPMQLLFSINPVNVGGLKKEYVQKELDKVPDDFIIYRIIGNNLYPLHGKGQTLENLKFILENEPELMNCKKKWVINRIIDQYEEQSIIELLNSYEQSFIHIPFCPNEYQKIGLDTECLPGILYLIDEKYNQIDPIMRDKLIVAAYRHKINYIMNVNGARNAALHEGKKLAKWILPWDGSCFLTSSAWEEIRTDIVSMPYLKYFVVPLVRVANNKELLSDDFIPNLVDEPQLVFRQDAGEGFNEDFYYGRRDKVELFWRLGIPGPWDRWKIEPWDLQRAALSPEAKQFGVAGWVARLYSGSKCLVQDSRQRAIVRNQVIIDTVNYVDSLYHNKNSIESLSATHNHKHKIYQNSNYQYEFNRARANTSANSPLVNKSSAQPFFLSSRGFGREERFLFYLAFGIVANREQAKKIVDRMAQYRALGIKMFAQGRDLSQYPPAELYTMIRELLKEIVLDKLRHHESDLPLTMGLSSGYDARAIFYVLKKYNVPVFTYTYGQAGNLDFDFIKLLCDRCGISNFFIDTSTVAWSLDDYQANINNFQDYPLSPRVVADWVLKGSFPNRIEIHGYLNGILTKSDDLEPSETWEEATEKFCKKNNPFNLQEHIGPELVRSLIPIKPFVDQEYLSFDRQLDLSLRQEQRVRPISNNHTRYVLPFEDYRWIGLWLGMPYEDLYGQRLYLDFLKSLKDNIFFDLNEAGAVADRASIKRYNIRKVYGDKYPLRLNPGQQSGFVRPSQPTAHFCLLTCYLNNQSFRNMILESVNRLKGRQIFNNSFVDDITRRFEAGDASATKTLNGLVSVDLLIETGIFDK